MMNKSFKYGKFGYRIFFRCSMYSALRTLFAKGDQEVAFLLSRLTEILQRKQREKDMERRLTQTLAALKDLSASLPPKEQAEVDRHQAQARYMVDKMRHSER